MDNSHFLEVFKSFNIPEESFPIVEQHLNNRGICTEEDVVNRGSEIQPICHIAVIINAVKKGGSVANVGEDLAKGFRDLLISKDDVRFFIPYDFIAFYIFEDSHVYKVDMVEEAYDEIIYGPNHDFFECQKEVDDPIDDDLQNNIEIIFKKILRHIFLAIHQKQYILENIGQAKEEVVKLKEDLNNLKEEATQLSKKSKNISARIQHTTGNYVAILGIFATIIFAVVGGINLFDSAAKYIRVKNEFILYVSTGFLALSLIIYFLFTWVHRLSSVDKLAFPIEAGILGKIEYVFEKYGFLMFLIVLLLIIYSTLFTNFFSREDGVTKKMSLSSYENFFEDPPANISLYPKSGIKFITTSTLR